MSTQKMEADEQVIYNCAENELMWDFLLFAGKNSHADLIRRVCKLNLRNYLDTTTTSRLGTSTVFARTPYWSSRK